MIGTPRSPERSPPAFFRRGSNIGQREFTVLLAMIMATTALSIDIMLPAFPEIREALGLAPGSTSVSGLLTAFFLGMAAAQIPAGLLADRYGRKVVLHLGMVLYLIGAVGALLAPSLGWMLIARFVWGVGAGGPRGVSMAIVRDRYSGDQMARVMSMVMAMFLLVPVVAPTIGSALLTVGSWQLVFGFCAVVGVALNLWALRLPETLRPENERPLRIRPVLEGAMVVLRSRETVLLGLALTAMMGSFFSYLASAEVIIDETFGMSSAFPLIFGGVAIGMGVANLVNGRIVERVGMWSILRIVLRAYFVISAAMVVIAFTTGGRPSPWLFLPVLGACVATHSLATPNVNSAAMHPVGAVAGMASALLGAISMAGGSLLGSVVDTAFDGTVRPLSIAFLASAVVALGAFRAAHRSVLIRSEPVLVLSPSVGD